MANLGEYDKQMKESLSAPTSEIQWEVEEWSWSCRREIPPGWEPFGYDSENATIICRREVPSK